MKLNSAPAASKFLGTAGVQYCFSLVIPPRPAQACSCIDGGPGLPITCFARFSGFAMTSSKTRN